MLIGGANRGAYEAGAVQALADRQGVRDGQPLDFDLVCGTSIGALNSFFIATAQYGALQTLWRSTIASENVFRLKSPYDQIEDKYSGIGNRIAAAVSLAIGLQTNVTGVLDPEPVWHLLDRYVDPAAPVHLPFYISTTNISQQTNRLFVRKATTPDGILKQSIDDQLLAPFPRVTRAVDDSLLHRVMFASAAIPLLFDPIRIARERDPATSDQYVDGGVTQNVPIDVAQRCADTINVMLLNPARHEVDERYDSALDVGMGMFATMQTRILDYQVRLAYVLGQTQLPFTPYVIRPEHPLPGHAADFNDRALLESMWQLGYKDMSRGWVAFAPPPEMPPGALF